MTQFFNYPSFISQGTVLSAFFWGYTMTQFFNYPSFISQGTVLSAFFWGYTMTQFFNYPSFISQGTVLSAFFWGYTMTQFFNYPSFISQGTVLSAFFWGYTMTQVLGGYLSDRVGGDTVITTAAVGWSLLTFWSPFLTYLYTDKASVLFMVVGTRVLLGVLQGKQWH